MYFENHMFFNLRSTHPHKVGSLFSTHLLQVSILLLICRLNPIVPVKFSDIPKLLIQSVNQRSHHAGNRPRQIVNSHLSVVPEKSKYFVVRNRPLCDTFLQQFKRFNEKFAARDSRYDIFVEIVC